MQEVERVTAKTGCTSCTKWTISFEVSGFHTEVHLLQRDFIFFKLIWTPLFLCVQNAPFKATSSIYNPFWLHLLFFMHLVIILSYETMKLKCIWNELWKGLKLAWYHHFTHIACSKSREGYGKNWMHFVYKTDNLFRSIRVSYGSLSVTKGFQFFWTYLNPVVFLCSKCTIQSHIINLQMFLTSFVIFHALTEYFELWDPEIEKHFKWTLKRLKVGMVSSFDPHRMCKK